MEVRQRSIGIIGGADGPTAIYLTSKLASHQLGSIAIAAYSYMALIPVIQPPIIKLFTTKKERSIKMVQLREVSKTEKILFPIVVTALTVLIIPSSITLIGMLMFGNLIKESGVVPQLVENVKNALLYIVTVFIGITVGATATAQKFLQFSTIKIIVLGLIAFIFGTAFGVIFGKIMCVITKGKVNPMIEPLELVLFQWRQELFIKWDWKKIHQIFTYACNGSQCCWCYRFSCGKLEYCYLYLVK